MISTTIGIVTANVQNMTASKPRQTLLTHWSKLTRASIFLLTEMNLKTDTHVADWTSEAEKAGFKGIIVKGSRTAIIWRSEEQHITVNPSDVNRLYTASKQLNTYQRTTDCRITIGTQEFRLISVYVPVEARNRPSFLVELKDVLAEEHSEEAIIMGGDWNVVEDSRIDSTKRDASNVGEQAMIQLSHGSGLADTYRHINPHKLMTTNTPTQTTAAHRRLDRIYISTALVDLTEEVLTYAAYNSTHVQYAVRLNVPGAQQTGSGFFKLGNHIVERPFMTKILSDMVSEFHAEATNLFPDDPFEAWDETKRKVGAKCQTMTRKLAQFDRIKENDPEHRKFLSQATRARMRPEETGEFSVKLRLTQVRQQSLVQSFSIEGEEVTDPNRMLGHATDHFEHIFRPKETDAQAQRTLLDSMEAKLTEEDKDSLERPYDEEELLSALKSIKKNASPGYDGLPRDFYIQIWEVTGPILCKLKNLIHTRQGLKSESQRFSVMPIAWKRNEKDRISNYRPLSNPNTDSKIFDKTDTDRLATVITKVIGPTQTGFIPPAPAT